MPKQNKQQNQNNSNNMRPSNQKRNKLFKNYKSNRNSKNKREVSNKQSNGTSLQSGNLNQGIQSPIKEFKLSPSMIMKLKRRGYKLYEPIGEGAYGKVFLAKSTKKGRRAAIKVIDLSRLSEPFINKFLNVEIELIKNMTKHQNIIKFNEVIEDIDNDIIYISMEYCPKGDLVDYINERCFIPEREACIWFQQLINGVQHIHENGFAHRDLKCENILLDRKYNIKIIDFGMCCQIRYNTKVIKDEEKIVSVWKEEIPSQTFCGSLIYASPEILRGQPYLPTMTDIWSCGVILYTMLFGNCPNDGKEMDKFILSNDHRIEAPNSSNISKECKQIIKNILVNETKRHTIEDIISSDWFKFQWQPLNDNIEEYFKNLNIKKVETLEFGNSSKESSFSLENNSNTKQI